jgi:oxygen-independent coproporphyrinogen-3 oxidase
MILNILDQAEQQLLDYMGGEPYLNYVYSYPHKTTYRNFQEPRSLKDAWKNEDKSSLFLYVHIPFCEMRCGYCNLFTTTSPEEDLVENYLSALKRQSAVTAEYLGGNFNFEQLAIGGGTPSYLSAEQLQSCFDILASELNAKHLPASVEVSPATVDQERLIVLANAGVERISMGVESFDKDDLKSLGRPQKIARVEAALQEIQDSKVPRLNVDLIYGTANESLESWIYSVDQALAWQPEEIFIYPLYIRPLTGLGKKQRKHSDNERLKSYFAARERILNAGYTQSSMRMFVRDNTSGQSGKYRCQEDGMIGLGAGARSYTQNLHYSSNYAVAKSQIKGIIQDYNKRSNKDFAKADYGVELDISEQQRRYVLLSLLQIQGLSFNDYRAKFKSDVMADLPQLLLLEKYDLANINSSSNIKLTDKGISYSDMIGSWLFSKTMKDLMGAWIWK